MNFLAGLAGGVFAGVLAMAISRKQKARQVRLEQQGHLDLHFETRASIHDGKPE